MEITNEKQTLKISDRYCDNDLSSRDASINNPVTKTNKIQTNNNK